jgi:hypothetical protein
MRPSPPSMLHPDSLARFVRLIMLLMILFMGGIVHAQLPKTPEEASAREGRPYLVVGLDEDSRLFRAVDDVAFDAWIHIKDVTFGQRWPGTVHIVWCKTEAEFFQNTGNAPEHFAAAASPERRLIWINPSKWRATDRASNLTTMKHEMAHILLHTFSGGGELPRWAEEGLAMHIAQQWSPVDSAALAEARFFGTLPSLEQLEHKFPGDSSVDMAYAMGYFAVEVIARSYGDEPGKVDRLLASLASERTGERVRADLWDPERREGLQLGVYHTLGSYGASAVIVFTTGTLFWGIVAALVVVAFLKKKRTAHHLARMEEEEESWARSLTEADIQDIYGDREGRFDEPENQITPVGPAPRKNPWPDAEN